MDELELVKKKKISNKKIMALIVPILLLTMIIGMSYAFFVYGVSGQYTQNINGGKIQTLYNETTGNNITINNVYPINDADALTKGLEFEFTVTGYNESEKDAYYTIKTVYGNDVTGKTRFKDSDIKISLYENGEMGFENKIFDNLNNGDLYYGVIKAGTNSSSPVTNTYKLRLWLNDHVIISNSIENDITLWDDDDWDLFFDSFTYLPENILDQIWNDEVRYLSDVGISVYTAEEFGNKYANFKVNVYADMQYKDNAQDASCFAYDYVEDKIIYNYPTIVLNNSSDKIQTCKNYMSDYYYCDGGDCSDANDGYQSFCEGTGTIGGIAIIDHLVDSYIDQYVDDFVSGVSVIDSYYFEEVYYTHDTSSNSVAVCKDYMNANTYCDYEDCSDANDGYQSFCDGTSREGNVFFYEAVESQGWFSVSAIDYFVENGVLIQHDDFNISGIEITDYDEDTCGTDVWIPEYIEGYPVTRIASPILMAPGSNSIYNSTTMPLDNNNYKSLSQSLVFEGYNQSFYYKGITSVRLPATIEYIGGNAFNENSLTNINLPENLKYIGDCAFCDNRLKKVIIPTSVSLIGQLAFINNPLIEVEVKGNSQLSYESFGTLEWDYDNDSYNFQTFKYGGTCTELNQYQNVFGGNSSYQPNLVITSDNNACEYTNIVNDDPC